MSCATPPPANENDRRPCRGKRSSISEHHTQPDRFFDSISERREEAAMFGAIASDLVNDLRRRRVSVSV